MHLLISLPAHLYAKLISDSQENVHSRFYFKTESEAEDSRLFRWLTSSNSNATFLSCLVVLANVGIVVIVIVVIVVIIVIIVVVVLSLFVFDAVIIIMFFMVICPFGCF